MRKSRFIIAIIAGILVFGIPFFSFAAEDTDPGSYTSDPEIAKAISDYIATHNIFTEDTEGEVRAYENISEYADGRLWLYKPTENQRLSYDSKMTVQFRTRDHWESCYTLPVVTIMNANGDDVALFPAKSPAVKDKTTEYTWSIPLKDYNKRALSSGKYYIGLITMPVDSDGELYEGVEDKYPLIARSFFIVPSGKVTIKNTIANSEKKANDVIWDKSKVRGATNYQISWRAKGGSWAYKNIGNTVKGTTTGLKIGQLYEIRVRPYGGNNSTYYGTWSNSVYRYFHTTEKIRLSSKKKGTFTISWKNNPQATGYQVMFTTNRNGSGAAKNINNIRRGQTSFTKSGLRSGVTYYVQIREVRNYAGKNWIGNVSVPVAVRVR